MTDAPRGPRRPATRVAGRRPSSADAGVPGPAGPSPSVLVAAIGAALGAALSGVAVIAAIVLVGWLTDAGTATSASDAVRAGADAWLLAHHGTLHIGAATVGLVPLGLTVLPALVLYRTGASLARRLEVADLAGAARATAALSGAYAVIAGAVGYLAAGPAASAAVGPAGFGAAVLAALAGGSGLLRAADLAPTFAALLPPSPRMAARAAAAAVAALLVTGVALVAVGLVAHAGRAAALTRALQPGLVGGGLLLVVDLLLVPTVAVWGAAYAAGPGFALGVGTSVSPFGAVLGPVPALPLLAALPQGVTAPPAARVVLVAPLAAGILAGIVLVRRGLTAATTGAGASRGFAGAGGRLRRGRWAVLAGGGTGLLAGAAMATLAALSGGPVGAAYLAVVGPSPWQVGLAVAVEIGIPAAITAAVLPGQQDRAADAAPGRPDSGGSAAADAVGGGGDAGMSSGTPDSPAGAAGGRASAGAAAPPADAAGAGMSSGAAAPDDLSRVRRGRERTAG